VLVPPSQTEDFVSHWKATAEKVQDEEHSIIYNLRKVGVQRMLLVACTMPGMFSRSGLRGHTCFVSVLVKW
jgi:hypothetical protein